MKDITVILFFLLLCVSLLFGDGKQGVIEVFGVSMVLVLWGYNIFSKRELRQVPQNLLIPWCCIALVALVSTLFSDSLGYSVSWWVRFLCGFLIYNLFYTNAHMYGSRLFVLGSAAFVGCAVMLSVASYLSPSVRAFLPAMNLADTRHGHSHLADLLVYGAPIIWYIGQSKKIASPLKLLGVFVYASALFFTFARGAWAVVGAFLGIMYVFLAPTARVKRAAYAVLLVAVVIAALYVVSATLPGLRSATRPHTIESRVEYWRQAWAAMLERPALGSGPGTFSLESLRLQSQIGKSSWFAHSHLLQIGAEMGLLGLAAFLWLWVFHGVLLYRLCTGGNHTNNSTRSIALGVTLLIVYGLFEYVLDYQATWLLLCAGLGHLAAARDQHSRSDTRPRRIVYAAPLVILGTFYVMWVTSSWMRLTTDNHDVAYYVAPFDSTIALAALEHSDRLPPQATGLMRRFFKKDPALLFALAQMTQKTDPTAAIELFRQAAAQDPQRIEYIDAYISSLLDQEKKSEISRVLGLDSGLSPFLTNELFVDIGKPRTKNEYFAKLYYFLGLAIIDHRPLETRELWVMARDATPGWGYFHIELASLYYYTFDDTDRADKILKDCQGDLNSKAECEFAAWPPPEPGSLLEQIKAIPTIL